MLYFYFFLSVKILFFNLATVQPTAKHHALEKKVRIYRNSCFVSLTEQAGTICFQVRIPRDLIQVYQIVSWFLKLPILKKFCHFIYFYIYQFKYLCKYYFLLIFVDSEFVKLFDKQFNKLQNSDLIIFNIWYLP